MATDKKRWHEQKEKASGFWQMRFMLWAYRLLGAKRLRAIVYPVVFCFYLFAPGVRAFSRDFLKRAAHHGGKRPPRPMDTYRHTVSFAFSMIEKIAAWSNDVDLDSVRFHDDAVSDLIGLLGEGKGAVVICSHMGNMELLRALATHDKTRVPRKFSVTSIVDFSGTSKFNRLIEKISPESMMRLVSARDIGVDTVIDLQERLASGGLLVIAGDRTSLTTKNKVEVVPFLGKEAEFPQGAFIMASLMEVPVFFMFGLRVNDMDPTSDYDLHVIKASTELSGSRRERKAKIRSVIGEYAGHLERFCAEHPFQWYNFYDFWNVEDKEKERPEQ